MRSQNRWTGIVVGVVLGVLFSMAVVLAEGLEPSAGPTQAVLQGESSVYLPITLNTVGSSSAGVPRTGQTPTVPLNPAPAGSDGALQKGVAWPNPRFTDNNKGTVTDNLTGLIWLKNANCTDTVGLINKSSGTLAWANALTWCNNLAGGHCGLTDGSKAGDWRLPNVKELQSLIDYAYWNPALSNAAGIGKWGSGDSFTDVQSDYYWSSTTYAYSTGFAWLVHLNNGGAYHDLKTSAKYVWPVRGGQ